MTDELRGWIITHEPRDGAEDGRAACVRKLREAASDLGMELEVKTHSQVTRDIEALQQGAMPLPDFTVYSASPHVSGAIIESLGVPAFNSYKAAFIARNKSLSYAACLAAGLAQPKSIAVPKENGWPETEKLMFIDAAAQILGYPFVAKTATGSLGLGVYKVQAREDALKFIDELDGDMFGIFQEYISKSDGVDVRMFVVGGEVVASMKRTSGNNGDFRANLHLGGSAVPYEPSTAEVELAVGAARAIGLEIAGVDLLLGDEPLICEVNSQPFFGIDDVCHTSVARKILGHIKNKIG